MSPKKKAISGSRNRIVPTPKPVWNEENKKNKRRWFWIIFAIIVAFLVAAAICIPLAIVLTRNGGTTTTTTTTTTVAATTTLNTCGWTVNTRTLLLSDTNTATVQTLINGLQAANLTVDYLPCGISNYTGTPNASCYGSVILLPGICLQVDMPLSGQQSIVNAQQNSGTGVVITELTASQVFQGKLAIISSLLLGTFTTGYLQYMDFTLNSVGHPIWNGLPTTFNTSVQICYSVLTAPGAGTVLIANCTRCSSPGVMARPQSGTAGRRVQIAHAGHYSFSSFNWANDPHLLPMMVNAVLWAAQLI